MLIAAIMLALCSRLTSVLTAQRFDWLPRPPGEPRPKGQVRMRSSLLMWECIFWLEIHRKYGFL